MIFACNFANRVNFLQRKFLQEMFFADLGKKLQKKILGHTASDSLGKTFYMHRFTYKDVHLDMYVKSRLFYMYLIFHCSTPLLKRMMKSS